MSIRLRVALVFTLALAVAFALGSWLFLTQLHTQLLNALDLSLQAQLTPGNTKIGGPRVIPGAETFVIQVISPNGRVLRASRDAGQEPLLPPGELARARTGAIALNTAGGDERYRVYARPDGPSGAVALVAQALDETRISGPLRAATTALIIGGIVFVLAGGAGAYWLAAAALSPVERMRRQVAALSVADTAGGVQVPGTRDELAALAGTMNDLLARLHEALARQRGFVADASHELRTPLAVLGAELELAGRPGRSRDELATAVANAEDEVARLTRLTNDLLLLARSDEGRLPVRPAPVDVAGLLARSAERAAGRAAQAGVTCAVDAPSGLVAELDEDRVRQAVDNLVDNALRFAPRGSVVRVAANRAGDGGQAGGDLVIEVADAGPGFPAEFLPHAFERFKRPDTSRARADGGAGLGLAIVAAIAAAHGGAATARNAPDGGAVVSIRLPGAVGAAAAPSGAAASGSAAEPGPSAPGPAR